MTDRITVAPACRLQLFAAGTRGGSCQLSLLATEPDDGVAPLIAAFNAAQVSIDYVPFELDDKRIVAALAEAEHRGVRIRALVEPAPGGDVGTSYAAIVALAKIGVEARDSNPAFSMTHAKYAVIDRGRALLLTFNSTSKDLSTRRDFAIVDDDPADVQFVQSVFDADWDQRSLEPIPPGFVVSPDNSNTALVGLVDSATRSIDIYAEKLLPSPLLDAILAAANRGVTVRILASPLGELRGATRDRVMQAIRSGHLQVRIPTSPRVHAKVMLVDGTSVFLGSENVQDASRERRRELGAVFQEPSIAARIQDTFDRDWSGKFDALN